MVFGFALLSLTLLALEQHYALINTAVVLNVTFLFLFDSLFFLFNKEIS